MRTSIDKCYFCGYNWFEMKKLLCVLCLILFAGNAGAGYDAFTADMRKSGDSASESVKFIPAPLYVRLGAGSNLGFAGSSFDIGGTPVKYNWGPVMQFGLGWNMFSFMRSEIMWGHSEMRFPGNAEANFETGRVALYIDLVRRHAACGETRCIRRVTPFVGGGAAGAWAEFNEINGIEGKNSLLYGGHGSAGFGFAFSETNAVDLMVTHEILFGNKFGWDDEAKRFGNTSITVSWRASF